MDPTLTSNIDFSMSDSFKLLITHSGVAELRAVLQYQIMHKQALIVACRTNQAMVDVHMKALTEIELMKEHRAFLPNAVYSVEKFIKRGGNEIDDGNVNKRVKTL